MVILVLQSRLRSLCPPFTHTLDVHRCTNTGNTYMLLFCFIAYVFPKRTLLLHTCTDMHTQALRVAARDHTKH